MSPSTRATSSTEVKRQTPPNSLNVSHSVLVRPLTNSAVLTNSGSLSLRSKRSSVSSESAVDSLSCLSLTQLLSRSPAPRLKLSTNVMFSGVQMRMTESLELWGAVGSVSQLKRLTEGS